MHIRTKPAISLLALALAASHAVAFAAELPPGTVISKENLDKIRNDTFEGKTIGSMLTEKVELQIRNYNLQLPLVHSRPVVVDPRFGELTRKYAEQVKFDPATREVSNWTAGLPFPAIAQNDPHAGDKLLWNFYLAAQLEGSDIKNMLAQLFIDGKKGVDKVTEMNYYRYYAKGRLDQKNPTEGDGKILSRTMFQFTAPYDMRGLSILTFHYDGPQLDDSWLYVKSMRRVRRLSGNNLLDAIGGSDILQDDVNLWNARPTWYPRIKLVGKRWILAMAHANKHVWDKSKKGTPEEFPATDLKKAPYWNPVNVWEPREVYVVEAEAPAEHVYGKKVLYMDSDLGANMIWQSEVYDKKGEFWKHGFFSTYESVGKQSNVKYRHPTSHNFFDFKAMHGTIVYIYDWVMDAGMKAEDVSIDKLEAGAK
jgi:hypothetical protein